MMGRINNLLLKLPLLLVKTLLGLAVYREQGTGHTRPVRWTLIDREIVIKPLDNGYIDLLQQTVIITPLTTTTSKPQA